MKTYQEGWDAYAAGRPVDVCETEAARRGWWAANVADAACLVVDYMAATGQDSRVDAVLDFLRQDE